MQTDDPEQRVTAVLAALAKLNHALVKKAADLRERLGVTEVTHALDISKTEADQMPEPPPGIYTGVVVAGYVDAPIEGARGVVLVDRVDPAWDRVTDRPRSNALPPRRRRCRLVAP